MSQVQKVVPKNENTAEVQQQVNDVVGIMNSNIGKVLARGEQLDALQNKTDELQQGSIVFKKTTKDVRDQMWWKSAKLNLIIGGIAGTVGIILVQDVNGVVQPIYDVIFTLDGTKLVATAGNEILVYDSNTGQVIKALKGHKENVICLCPLLGDGFASGGADKQVIIWSNVFQGTLKYSHGENIQSISQNPITGVVLSCTSTDFGLWSPEVKAVPKTKVGSRILCSSWTPDGQQFALGLFNGHISIRSSSGEEQVRIERGSSPVWALKWSIAHNLEHNILAVADWSQKLSFFQSNGRQLGKDKILDYDPCSINFFGSGEYIIMGGSDKEVNLWTADGIKIGNICKKEGWIWSCKSKPNQPFIAVGSADGTISMHQIQFNSVQCMYRDKYAYRQNMTDVVIQNLTTNQQSRIKCRSHVRKLSIFKDILLVQTSSRIFIYEAFKDEPGNTLYRIKEKINDTIECTSLIATSHKLLATKDSTLSRISFEGEKEHEWTFEATIRYVKSFGGPKGSESLLVGLKNGSVIKLFVDNHFQIPIIKHNFPIICLDINLSRQKIAVVDDNSNLLVFDINSKELLFQEHDVNSVAWNLELEDSISYTGNGSLSVKVGNFSPYQEKFNGFVVGFKGASVFCLKGYQISNIEIPQTIPFDAYIDGGNYQLAYQIGCLGVPDSDWKRLAHMAMEHLDLETAQKAFIRVSDFKNLEAVRNIMKALKEDKRGNDVLSAEVLAHNGVYQEAAKLFKKSGNLQKAIDMYTELDMWDAATQLVQENNEDTHEILKRKAQSQVDRKDVIAAASTYEQVGDYFEAIELLGEGGWIDKLNDLVEKRLTSIDEALLKKCISYFKASNNLAFAMGAVKKLGDTNMLLNMHLEAQNWDAAFKIGDVHPEYNEQIYLPYGNWLALNDRYDEAQFYYTKAGRPEDAIKVLKLLAENAVVQNRFKRAAYYYYLICTELIKNLNQKPNISEKYDIKKYLDEWKMFSQYSELYYAYDQVFKYIEDPFTMCQPESLMNSAKFVLVHIFNNSNPPNISTAYTLYCLAKISFRLKCYKTCKFAYEKLMQLKLPLEWQETVDLAALLIRGKPITDPENILPICFQCLSINAFINLKELSCGNCSEPFVFSFFSFENLPLIQFQPKEGIDDDECQKLLRMEIPLDSNGADLCSFTELDRDQNEKYSPIKLDREQLMNCEPHRVFIKKFNCKLIPDEYYLLKDNRTSVIMCQSCQKFFIEDEWNYQVLLSGKCPFCDCKSKISG